VTFSFKLFGYRLTFTAEKERPGHIFEDRGGKFILVTKKEVPKGEPYGSWADGFFYPNQQYFEKVYLEELGSLPKDHFVVKAVEKAKKKGWKFD